MSTPFLFRRKVCCRRRDRDGSPSRWNNRTTSKGEEEKGKRSRNIPGGPSRSLILIDRPMSDGTRYNTLMNSRSILARSNAKSIFNYPSPSTFRSFAQSPMHGGPSRKCDRHENNERSCNRRY